MLKSTIEDIISCRLSEAEIKQHLLGLTVDKLDDAVLDDFVEALRSTLDEESHALAQIENVFDCSGTGGSGLPHFNTSTTCAFVLAAGGLRVAKFGNRAAQSASGSFDLLEVLGIPLSLAPGRVAPLLDELNLVFLFARQYYSCLNKLAPMRKALGVKTVFNTIGPLLNPLRPAYRLMGTGDAHAQDLIASHLATDGLTRRAIVVRSLRGLDEIEPGEENKVLVIEGKGVRHYNLPPRPVVHDVAVRAFTTRENAALFHMILHNDAPAYFRDLVCINAGAGFMAGGVTETVEAGERMARALLAEGAVKEKFEQCKRAYAK